MSKNRRKIKKLKQKAVKRKIRDHKAETFSSEQQKPHFSLEYLDGEYSLSGCDKVQKAAFADTLHKLSQLTWAQLKRAGRHGSGYEKIEKHSLKRPVPGHITDDVNIIAFRFCGKAPMVGYRNRRTFYVIWLDINFSLYSHG